MKAFEEARPLTLISIVLDETGSMTSCRGQTISGFNEYILSQKNQPGDCLVRLTKFDTYRGVRVLHESISVRDIGQLTHEDFIPNGMTNLYDAIGQSISETEQLIDTLSTKPAVLFVVLTDGENNQSIEYSRDDISRLITEKEKQGWTFVYLGANQDAWAVGKGLGFSARNTMSYDTAEMVATMDTLAASTTAYRSASSMATKAFFGSGDSPVDEDNDANQGR